MSGTTFQLLMAEAFNDAYNLAYALLLLTRGWGTGLIGAALLIVWFLKVAHHFSYYHNDLSR